MTKMKAALLTLALMTLAAGGAIAQQRLPAFDLSVGGNQTALGVAAAKIINARPCILYSLTIVNPGSGGTLTVNDSATIGGASSSNTLLSIASSSLAVGQTFQLAFPVTTGIVVSAVPTGGSINIAYSYSSGN
jgi:hypothetical protein